VYADACRVQSSYAICDGWPPSAPARLRPRRVWRSIDRLRSFRFTYAIKLQLEPMDFNSAIDLTFLLLQLETSKLCHSLTSVGCFQKYKIWGRGTPLSGNWGSKFQLWTPISPPPRRIGLQFSYGTMPNPG